MTVFGRVLRTMCRCGAALLLGGYLVASFAAVDDDYKSALQAYNRGDMTAAINTLRKSADSGHAPSQALLAYILDQSDYDEEAVVYFRKAAEQGNADGEYGLGRMYTSGEGVKRDIQEGRRWILKAAQRGHVLATAVIAQAYIRGELGITESERASETAHQWIRRAAETDHVPSLEHLAAGYRKGINGFAVDLKQAEYYEMRVKQVRGITAKPPAKRRN